MKHSIYTIVLVIFCGLVACTGEKTVNLYAPPEPVVVSMLPARGSSGTEVTFKGRRFSGSMSENIVTFDGKQAEVIESADNKLIVRVPTTDFLGEVEVKITVNGYSCKSQLFTYTEKTFKYMVSTYAGSSSGALDGTALSAKFQHPNSLLLDKSGNIIVADRTNHLIRSISPDGTVSTIAGIETGSLSYPWQVALDSKGNIIVADKGSGCVKKVTKTGEVSIIAGTGKNGYAEGDALSAQFNNPLDVVVDANDNIYVADRDNKRIRKITPEGQVSTLAGGNGEFGMPSSLLIDRHGNIIVADISTYYIKMIAPDGTISTIAGLGQNAYSDGEIGNPLTAAFGQIFGMNLDEKGNILIADASNVLIRKLTLGKDGSYAHGTVSTLAGVPKKTGKVNGDALQATFNNPYDVIPDGKGNIYVADASNHLVRLISLVEE